MVNIIPRRKIWFTISSILVLGSILAVFVNGLKLGIDFTGGSLIEIKLADNAANASTVEASVLSALPSLEEIKVQSSGQDQFIVRIKELSQPEHQLVLESLLAEFGEIDELRFESIGPTLGAELKDKAITALIVASIVIILYIAWSFRKVLEPVQSWKYGVGAIIALVHEVDITTGIYSFFTHYGNYQVDGLFITALLVVLGYSVNDTIVVYDRIRENVLNKHVKHFEELVNKSVNDTITRSINTSFTTLLVLLTLFFFGGASIQGFVLALIIGVVIGTYSSIFLASPILVVWAKYSQRKK